MKELQPPNKGEECGALHKALRDINRNRGAPTREPCRRCSGSGRQKGNKCGLCFGERFVRL